jgi:hypothetical protein
MWAIGVLDFPMTALGTPDDELAVPPHAVNAPINTDAAAMQNERY